MLRYCHAAGSTLSLCGLFCPHTYALPDRQHLAVHSKYVTLTFPWYSRQTAEAQEVYMHDEWFELPDGRVEYAGLAT